MGEKKESLRQPCYTVLDWIMNKSDASKLERSAAQTMQERGLTGDYQEKVLSKACEASGMCAVCEHSDKCGIGDIERPDPANRRKKTKESTVNPFNTGKIRLDWDD
jgi:hypothetical protein